MRVSSDSSRQTAMPVGKHARQFGSFPADCDAGWCAGAPTLPSDKMEIVTGKPTQKSVKIAAGAVVCVESEIKGDVTIGPRTVVHPKARIIAEAGPIIIGEGNLIEEQALITNSYPENLMPQKEDIEPKVMTIGTNNVFEVGCRFEALKIGDNNVIESKAFIGRNVILTSGCIIGACCQVNSCEVVPENTVIYGIDCMRRVQSERPQPQTLQLDFLMKILPNYHHLKKTVKGSSTPIKS